MLSSLEQGVNVERPCVSLEGWWCVTLPEFRGSAGPPDRAGSWSTRTSSGDGPVSLGCSAQAALVALPAPPAQISSLPLRFQTRVSN